MKVHVLVTLLAVCWNLDGSTGESTSFSNITTITTRNTTMTAPATSTTSASTSPANASTTTTNSTETTLNTTVTGPTSTSAIVTHKSISPARTTAKSTGGGGSSFDVGSFFGGAALVAGLVIVALIGYKVYSVRSAKGYNAM